MKTKKLKIQNSKDLDREILKTQYEIELAQLTMQQSTQQVQKRLNHPEKYILSWIHEKIAHYTNESKSFLSTFLEAFLRRI